MADKIKFLMGTISDITDTASAHYPPVIGGRVYFSIDSLTSTATATQGRIYFDVPTNDGRAKRILMNDRVSFATNASTASYADLANKATNDSTGQVINQTYIKGISVSGTTLTWTYGNNNTSTAKLQDVDNKLKVTSTSTIGTKVYLAGFNSTALADNGGTQTSTGIVSKDIYIDTDGRLNATVTNASTASVANKAIYDANNRAITSTYVTNLSIDGHTLTWTYGDNANKTATLPDNDYRLKVTSTSSVGSKIFLVGNATTALSTAGQTNTGTGVVHKDIYIDTNGQLHATVTNAVSASTATRAIKDSKNQDITGYIYNVRTSTATVPTLIFANGNGDEPNNWQFKYTPIGDDGKIDIKYIPNTAIERFIKAYASTAAMLNDLGGTNPSVAAEPGDLVKAGNSMYVITSTALGNISSYEEFAVGTAGSVAWGNVTGKPPVLTTASSASLVTSTATATLKIDWIAYDNSQRNQSFVIPAAATNVAGLVTTGAQTFAGNKTFNGLTSLSTANISKQLNYSGIGQSGNSVYYLWLASTASKGIPLYSTALTYTASSNTLNVTANRAIYDGSTTTTPIVERYMLYDITAFSTATNVWTIKNGANGEHSFQIQNYYPSSATWAANSTSVTLTIRNRSQHSSALVSSAVSATIPLATTTAAGIVSAATQTFGGDKIFNGKITAGNKIAINSSADSTWSGDNNASLYTQGGISVHEQLSAKQVRIDDSSGSGGKAVTLKFDASKEVLSFVFS